MIHMRVANGGTVRILENSKAKVGLSTESQSASTSLTSIPDMQLWLDASDLSTTFNATVGGNLVTTNGSTVARWEDKSGNNNHFTQATAGSRPVLNLANQNNKSVIYFDGENDWISGAVAGFNSFNAATVIMATKPARAAGADQTSFTGWQWGSATTASNRMLFGYRFPSPIDQETFGMMINNNRGTLATTSTTYSRAANTAQILTVTLSPTGTKLYANSSEVTLNLASAATTTSNSSPSNYGYTADSIIRLNTTGSAIGPANRLCEFLVFNRVLNSTERTGVWNYLTTKWNIV